jgi:hypothetical protein
MLHRQNIEDVVVNDEFLENRTGVSFDELLYSVESAVSSEKELNFNHAKRLKF